MHARLNAGSPAVRSSSCARLPYRSTSGAGRRPSGAIAVVKTGTPRRERTRCPTSRLVEAERAVEEPDDVHGQPWVLGQRPHSALSERPRRCPRAARWHRSITPPPGGRCYRLPAVATLSTRTATVRPIGSRRRRLRQLSFGVSARPSAFRAFGPHAQGAGPSPFSLPGLRRFRAVRDVSFEIQRGKCSGGRTQWERKSTLLKCLAGIYRVDETGGGAGGAGTPVSCSSSSGLDSTRILRRTITSIINGIMLGLTRKEARARFDEIIAFADFGEFLRPQAQELLLGHVRAPRLLCRRPGGRRRAAHRRGPGCRRLRVSAKMLRSIPPAAGRGQDDGLRHPRHGRRLASLRPCHADGARRDLVPGAPGSRRPRIPRTELRAPTRRRRQGRGARFGDRGAEILDAWIEDENWERTGAVAQRDPFSLCMEIVFHEDLAGSDLRLPP